MNRREFTKGLAAAGLAPALPLPSLAKAAPAAMAAKDPMYFWANFVSRVHNNCTPDMFSRLLKLEPGHSATLFNQLIADGAITAPDAFGLSQSTNPLYPEYSRVMGHGKKVVESLKKSNDFSGKAETRASKPVADATPNSDTQPEPEQHVEDLDQVADEDETPQVDEDFTSS